MAETRKIERLTAVRAAHSLEIVKLVRELN